MTIENREELLRVVAQVASPEELSPPHPLATFLPLHPHRRALKTEVVVVLGSRGAGKTALFNLVRDPASAPKLRAFFEDEYLPEGTWFDAFSIEGTQHPDPGILAAYAPKAQDLTLRAFWMLHLLRRVLEVVPGLVTPPPAVASALEAPVADVGAWLPGAEANIGAVHATLDAADRALKAADRLVFAAYDNLDLIGPFDPSVRRRYIRTLLALWLSYASRYKNLRGKIFLRDDLFDAEELGFADASKLRPASESLTWDHGSLYRVVVRHLVTRSAAMRAFLADVPGLVVRDRGEFGWTPGELSNEVQRDLVAKLAGKVIGKGVIKGYTHTWILNRLSDARRQITPRAMLWFFAFAGQEALEHPRRRRYALLNGGDLLVAVQKTSRERVSELKDEYPLVKRIENLRGMKIPLDRAEVVQRLEAAVPGELEAAPERGEVIFAELLRLGVLGVSEAGEVDVPDIYRYRFAIGPNYAKVWRSYIDTGDPVALEQFARDLPGLKELLERAGDSIPWADVAEEDIKRGDWAAAYAKCERALGIAQNARDSSAEAKVWLQMCRVSSASGDHESARHQAMQAGEQARRAADRALEASSLRWLGISDHELKNFDIAGLELSLALHISAELNDAKDQATSLILLAINELRKPKGRIDTAVGYLLRALECVREFPSSARELSTFDLLADIAQHKADLRAALALILMWVVGAAQQGVTIEPYVFEKQAEIAAKLAYTPAQVEALEREVREAYAHDRGLSYIRALFPAAAVTPS